MSTNDNASFKNCENGREDGRSCFLSALKKKNKKTKTKNKNKKQHTKKTVHVQDSAVATGGQGSRAPPLTTACAPLFRSTQNTFLEHHVTTRQQTMMEKGIIMFKNNFRINFSQFFAKLLATNYCT